MDEEIERLVVSVRADTAGFARDVAEMRGVLDGPFQEGAERVGRALESALLRAVRTGKLGFEELKAVADKGGVVHCVVGRMSFDAEKLVENVRALIRFVEGLNPASSKGNYVRGIALSATQSPGILVTV